jgi:hypothetical protein
VAHVVSQVERDRDKTAARTAAGISSHGLVERTTRARLAALIRTDILQPFDTATLEEITEELAEEATAPVLQLAVLLLAQRDAAVDREAVMAGHLDFLAGLIDGLLSGIAATGAGLIEAAKNGAKAIHERTKSMRPTQDVASGVPVDGEGEAKVIPLRPEAVPDGAPPAAG